MSALTHFEEATLRLKQQLKVTEDKQVAEALGMTGSAWTKRKTRGAFPEKELRALAQQRPELGIDVGYVLGGRKAMHLDLIGAAERATSELHEAAAAGMSHRDLFTSALSEQRHALSDADWLILFITLRGLSCLARQGGAA